MDKIQKKYKCHDCGKKLTKEERVEVRTPYKAFVCEDCADNNYCLCERCQKKVIADLIAYSGSVQCCDKCAGEIQSYTRMGNPIW